MLPWKWFLLLFLATAQLTQGQDSLSRYEHSTPAMGTTFRLTFYASSPQEANNLAKLAFDRINELNEIFSDYHDHSEASMLARQAGQRVAVSDDLWHLLKLSKTISKQTKGAFDITVGPLSKLWRHSIRQGQFPDSAKIRHAQKLVNYRWIKLYPAKKQVKLKRAGMQLDFGAIAKGYAIDQAYLLMRGQGIRFALVDGGGDLFVGDTPLGGRGWSVKDQNGNILEIPANSGVATSGDTYQQIQWNGSRYSHIIDPKLGIGLKDSKTVTVRAPTATVADALSSAVSVLDRDAAKKLLRKYHAEILEGWQD